MIIKILLMTFLSQVSFADDMATVTPTPECRGDLKMVVNGLANDDGQIKFDLDNSSDTFKPKENAKPSFAKGRSPIKDKRVEYIFKDIPCGEYAIKFYHDANMNQILDKNFLGIPKEEYGFSNCKGCTLPPSFEKAKFLFNKEHPIITIEL